jgi:L,D-peptidoglycan transpeptidase YkuD (ErfK/YbiS/YcfS/YnhG family)
MKKSWRNVLIITAIAVSIPMFILLLIRISPNPPVAVMNNARIKLSQARSKRADTYSKKLYAEAKIFYDSAMANWQKENRRFLFIRDYEKVTMFAELSAKKSAQAEDNSISSTTNLRKSIIQKIDALDSVVSDINKFFNDYPLSTETRIRISKGKMFLEEARIAYNKREYLQSNRKLTDAEYLLISSYENATANLKNYFNSYPIWKKWVNATIKESEKNGDYSIIIDKFSRKCFVYLSGTKKYEFEAELGANWVGDKRIKGDKATPEGMYKITKKFEGSKTKYYKALLLDYPNEEDKKKFISEIENGFLPVTAKIGSLIEIHGNGGKGIDWTEGCIALTDKEIDLVYKNVKIGTPVTIVGSVVDLANAMKR